MCRISVILHLVFFAVAACGQKWGEPSKVQLSTKIAGGNNADIRDFPYLAYIEIYINNDTRYCAGSVISDQHILTAAHCVFHNNGELVPSQFIGIFLGRVKENYYGVYKIVAHPDFESNQMIPDNDIAILELSTPIGVTDLYNYEVIPLRRDDELKDGEKLRIAGWGAIKENGKQQDVLQATTVQIVNSKYCNVVYSTSVSTLITSLLGIVYNINTDNMFCAGGILGGKGGCYGDDGGPAVSTETGELVGVFIGSRGCGRYPSVYTKVAAYIDFIAGATGGQITT